MTNPHLEHLELLAQVDELVDQLAKWSNDSDLPWTPVRQARRLVDRLLERVESLRVRLEAPLVVAVFGGTGTGKSSLVNALVGEECSPSGWKRPTTRCPVVVAGPDVDLDVLGLAPDECEIVRREAAILRDLVLVDCPDPDTSETDDDQTNLARLERVLPHCDVLLVTGTQQKYRSARISELLARAATGCRLLFVQTRADVDADIRDDWQRALADDFDCPEVFLVDSLRALALQQEGRRPGGDFGRLEHMLTSRLAASERIQVRRANLVDLLDDALARCRGLLDERAPDLESLEQALAEQQKRVVEQFAQRLQHELEGGHHLWERRLVDTVTRHWGFSPFASLLRLAQGLGGLLASLSLLRARSSIQLALLGAWQGGRWLASKSKDREAEQRVQQAVSLEIEDADLLGSQVVIRGYAHDASFDLTLADRTGIDQLRSDTADLQTRFLDDARRRIDEVIDLTAHRNSGLLLRLAGETLLCGLLGFILYRIGRNFFYDSFWLGQDLLPTDFYFSAAILTVLWSVLLVMGFTRLLRRGLKRQIGHVAEQMAEHRVTGGLFPDLDAACRKANASRDRLAVLGDSCHELRVRIAGPSGLGAPISRQPAVSRQD